MPTESPLINLAEQLLRTRRVSLPRFHHRPGQGWVRGELLNAAEAAGFELLVTTDKNMRYRQNLTGRKIAIVVIGNAQWLVLRRYVERVLPPPIRQRRVASLRLKFRSGKPPCFYFLKLQSRLESDQSGRAVAAEPDTQQPRRWRDCVGQGAEAGLC